jgi:hypothetical protein
MRLVTAKGVAEGRGDVVRPPNMLLHAAPFRCVLGHSSRGPASE